MTFGYQWIRRNLHLILSLVIVLPTGIIYGIPDFIEGQLDINVSTIDLANFLKAIMMLYLGFSSVWFVGAVLPKYWKIATLSNVFFMLTLAFGRTISMVIDGIPSAGYVFGVCAEFGLGALAFFQLKWNDALLLKKGNT